MGEGVRGRVGTDDKLMSQTQLVTAVPSSLCNRRWEGDNLKKNDEV